MFQIDVYAGLTSALVRPIENSTYFGTNGFVDVEFPNSPLTNYVKKVQAAEFLVKVVSETQVINLL